MSKKEVWLDMKKYNSLENEDFKHFLNDQGSLAMAYSKKRIAELRLYAEEGKWTWKVAGLFAGLTIVALSLLSLISNIFSFSIFAAIIDIYLVLFGIVLCSLEMKDKIFSIDSLNSLRKEALFLYRPYGRAAFYFFIGVLIVVKGGILNLVLGSLTSIIGIILYLSANSAIKSLNEIKDSRLNEEEIKEKFFEFDKDRSGALDSTELAALCNSLGTNLSLNELESALLLLDKNGDGKISFEEFYSWWKGNQ